MGCNSSKDSGWMGCNSLKINDSEVVRRCRKRKQMMSDAVKYRQEFALAHLAYIQTLQDVGYALCQFSDRQLSDMEVMPPSSQVLSTSQTSVVAATPPSIPPTPPSNLPAKHEKPLPRSFLPLQQQAPTYLDSDANHSSSTTGVNLTREDHDRRVSPVRSGGSSPAFYSPLRELPSDVLMASVPASPFRSLYYPPSQPSSPQSSAWDPFNLFSSPLPFHSQKHMISDVQGLEQDRYQADNSMREEGMPDLEEDEQNDHGKEQPEPSRPSGEQNHGKVISMEISENVAVTLTEISEDEVLNKINEKQAGMAEATLVGKKPNNIQGDEIQAKRELASTMMERVKELTEFVGRLDDAFGRASESGQKVSEMLETQMVYSHESIVDYSDLFRFGNTITWHWSRKAAPQQEGIDDTSNVVRHDTGRSHSLTLERLYTWEKKLYKEVKAGEQLHVAFARKRKEFNSLDAKGKDSNLMEQTRAALKSLDSRLMVTFKAISSASTRIQQVTNDELYPQLVELSARLKNMWKEMLECHTTQEAFAQEIQIHEKPGARFAASDSHRNSTINLEQALERWQQNFHWWVNSQQKYIDALLTWIRICHMEPEAHIKGGALSPARTMGRPPIHLLARNWHDSLVCLEENMEVVAAIKRFAGMVHDLQLAQLEELTQMKHAEMLTKGVDRRSLSFRHMERREEGQQHTHEDQVRNMKAALEREDTTFSTLQQHLPNIFKALTTFSAVAFREYENIHKGITPTHPHTQREPPSSAKTGVPFTLNQPKPRHGDPVFGTHRT